MALYLRFSLTALLRWSAVRNGITPKGSFIRKELNRGFALLLQMSLGILVKGSLGLRLFPGFSEITESRRRLKESSFFLLHVRFRRLHDAVPYGCRIKDSQVLDTKPLTLMETCFYLGHFFNLTLIVLD